VAYDAACACTGRQANEKNEHKRNGEKEPDHLFPLQKTGPDPRKTGIRSLIALDCPTRRDANPVYELIYYIDF
jgi:hypothetical protein